MNTTRPIKLIKNEDRKESEPEGEVEPPEDPNKWSKEVRSWVVESQQNRQVESLQAFESLFKEELPEPGSAD